VAKALWAVDVLEIGDESFNGLVNMTRASLRAERRADFDQIVQKRRDLVRDRRTGALILPD
jgi:hypothetical protein